MLAIIIASCPAPLVIDLVLNPFALQLSFTILIILSANFTGSALDFSLILYFISLVSASSSAIEFIPSSTCLIKKDSGDLISIVNSTLSGITLLEPGYTSISPTVATVLFPDFLATSSIFFIIIEAATKASFLMFIGVVPAWSACPEILTCIDFAPTI